jgi:hypothetical protein
MHCPRDAARPTPEVQGGRGGKRGCDAAAHGSGMIVASGTPSLGYIVGSAAGRVYVTSHLFCEPNFLRRTCQACSRCVLSGACRCLFVPSLSLAGSLICPDILPLLQFLEFAHGSTWLSSGARDLFLRPHEQSCRARGLPVFVDCSGPLMYTSRTRLHVAYEHGSYIVTRGF